MKHHMVIEIDADDLTQLELYLEKIPLLYAEKLLIVNKKPAQISYVDQHDNNKLTYKWDTKI